MTDTHAIRLAMVDNDEISYMGLASILQRALPGYKFVWGETCGLKAISHALDPSNGANILLVDMSLEDIPGDMVCREIRRANETLPLLAVTSYSLNRYMQRASDAGAQGIVSKSEIAEVCRAIMALRRGHAIAAETANEHVDFEDMRHAHRRLALAPASALRDLSERERTAMMLYAHAYKPAEIAAMMSVSIGSVKTYLDRAQKKLNVKSRSGLTVYWWKQGS